MEFTIILPSGETVNIVLKSKELKGSFLLNKIFERLHITGDAKLYFGLRYSEKGDGTLAWLNEDDNLKSFSFLSSSSRRHPSMQLAIQIFPKNPELSFATADSRVLFRQQIKSMMIDNKLGCDSKSHAVLDSFIAQSELGDYFENDKEYIKKLNNLNIFAPSLLGASTPMGETGYMKLVRSYHKKLNGMRSTQADILFMSKVQTLPLYGYKIFNVSDKTNNNFFLGLSEDGIHFIYDSFIEIYSVPKRQETFAWGDLVYSELIRNKVKLGFLVKGEEFIEHNIKILGNYSIKEGAKLLLEVERYKSIFLSVVDGGNVFKSRKKAQRAYSAKIPRKPNLNRRVIHSLRSSLRFNKKIQDKDFTFEKNNHERRLHSE